MDEYSYFYLSWVKEAIYAYDEALSPSYWLKQHASSKFRSWSGYVFESICLKHIRQIIDALKLSVVADGAAYWENNSTNDGKGAQIDLIISRADHCMNLCEIKFWSSEYKMTSETAQKLIERREIFREIVKSRMTLFNTLISCYGANENKHYLAGSVTFFL